MEDTSHWREILTEVYGGRDWLLAFDVLAATPVVVDALDALGAGRLMCVSGTHGAGATPDPSRVPEQVVLGVAPAASLMEAIWATQAALADVPDGVRARVDAWDPEGRARSIGTLYDGGFPVAGRAKFGARAPKWMALEDKTVVDALWAEAGLAAAPHAICALDDLDALRAAHAALDAGLGTVLAGDARSGFHGAASMLRWVRDDAALTRAAAELSVHCGAARVMPFLEGVPCSVHGVVFPEHVVAVRPCEMMVLRREGADTLMYTGTSTLWDPPPARREEMREAARRVGAHLRARYGYRGAFSLDGVMTAEGFRPTELNPRFGAALNSVTVGLTDFPFKLLNLAVVEGVEADWQPERLEQVLVRLADAHRHHRTMAVVSADIADHPPLALDLDAHGEPVDAADPDDATVRVITGDHPMGGVVLVSYAMDRMTPGPSAAPLSRAVLAHLDERWGLGLGGLACAVDVDRA
jgi:hypothetical protein